MTGKGFFIAGTDTGIGKTIVTGLLAEYFIDRSFSVITQKWVQTGSSEGNSDVHSHVSVMGGRGTYPEKYASLTGPYSFSFPASPHLAASMENTEISSERIKNCFFSLSKDFDIIVVEGTGGILVPLNDKELFADIIKSLDLDVILVVGNKLGAINHALLSVEALRSRDIRVTGLIFNRFSPDGDERILRNNRSTVAKFSGLTDMGEIPYDSDPRRRSDVFKEIGDTVMRCSLLDLNLKV